MAQRTFVIMLGGSFLVTNGVLNVTHLEEIVGVIKQISTNNRIIVVVGGGEIARYYIEAAASLGSNRCIIDVFGIMISRVNARLLIEAINDLNLVNSEPCETLQEIRTSLQLRKVVVLGGLQPGQSLACVTALCAEYMNANHVIFCADTNGLFLANPEAGDTGVHLAEAKYSELKNAMLVHGSKFIDDACINVLDRSGISSHVISYSKNGILDAIQRKKIGTTLLPS